MERYRHTETRSHEGWLDDCRVCRKPVTTNDDYVRIERPWGVKYYHRKCAEKAGIKE